MADADFLQPQAGQRQLLRPLLQRVLGHPALARPALLRVYLLMVAAQSLLYYLVPSGHYPREVNLLLAVLAAFMWPLASRPAWMAVLVHMLTAITTAALLYIAACTGGINSSVVVWLAVLPIAVLLLQGSRATLVWIGLELLSVSALYVLTWQGVIDPRQPQVHLRTVLWAWMNHALVLFTLMLAVYLYDRMLQTQLSEIGQRNTRLHQTHQALMATRNHKDAFVAAVGHELRTPMNAILGLNDALRCELSDRPDDLAFVDHIRHATESLLQEVNNILDHSQLQAGKLHLQIGEVDLHQLLQQTLAQHEGLAHARGIDCSLHLASDVPQWVLTDPRRLRQLLDALFQSGLNALQGQSLCLHVALIDGQVRFDFGCASPADAPLVSKSGATGAALTDLSLNLSAALAQRMGGCVGVWGLGQHHWLRWVALPLPAVQGVSVPNTQSPALPADCPLRVLLVDDNAVNLMVARLQLLKAWPQAQVVQAANGREAWELLQTQRFDVGLFDVQMPQMDGPELTRHLRACEAPELAHMPVLALTAHNDPLERARCQAAGMDGVLQKPVPLDVLVHSISALVHTGRLS